MILSCHGQLVNLIITIILCIRAYQIVVIDTLQSVYILMNMSVLPKLVVVRSKKSIVH